MLLTGAARSSSRRSTLKSVHWTDLSGFAGRASPPHIRLKTLFFAARGL
jgi:hypothetical protein